VSDPSAATDEASSLAHELTDRMQRLERTVQQSERARAAEAEAGALEKKLEERDAQMLFMLDQLRHTKAELDVAHKELGEDRDHLLKLQSRG
jgi:chromosome segregation ATPase